MSLAPLVQLYRFLETPRYEGGVFEGCAEFELVREYIAPSYRAGAQFIDLVVDGDDVEVGELPRIGKTLQLKVRPPAKSSSQFYKNFSALLDGVPQIGRGVMPEDFYLVEENFYIGDEGESQRVEKLKCICSLIEKIASLAHYHDDKTRSNFLRLVFIKPDEIGSSQPVIVETRLTLSLLDEIELLSLKKLEGLSKADVTNDQRHVERVGVFRNTVAEFLKPYPESERFENLVRRWASFLKIYDQNLAVYLSGFAFHKAKREVAEAELDVSSKLSQVVGDITGKLLSIPVSLLAVVAVARSDSWAESSLLVLGLLIASIIISELIANQQRRLRSVVHSKNLVLSAFEGRKNIYPEELKNALEKAGKDLGNDVKKLKRLLWAFRALCWMPVLSALCIHVFKYSSWL